MCNLLCKPYLNIWYLGNYPLAFKRSFSSRWKFGPLSFKSLGAHGFGPLNKFISLLRLHTESIISRWPIICFRIKTAWVLMCGKNLGALPLQAKHVNQAYIWRRGFAHLRFFVTPSPSALCLMKQSQWTSAGVTIINAEDSARSYIMLIRLNRPGHNLCFYTLCSLHYS